MCGIAGFLINNSLDEQVMDKRKLIYSMLEPIKSRGPDDEGHWSNENSQITLGHKRLSIQDLSKAGHQPMSDQSQRYVITFNGEIYNHREIRKLLKGKGHNINWKGTSDTETLVESISKIGLKQTLEICEGMFAFAIWDKEKEELNLVRDRFGEKPLYYYYNPNSFIFSSEIKSIKIFPKIELSLKREAIVSLLTYNYIRGPYSIYENIYKLQPGTILRVKKEGLQINFTKYWDTFKTIKYSLENQYTTTNDETTEIIHSELRRSIKQQSIAEVPIGCFLSGGIDSSLVTAIMQSQTRTKVKTFSIGFEERSFDESHYSKKISEIIGTDHSQYILTSSEAINLIKQIPKTFDEPFSDSSQLPALLVSQLASKDVKVCLTGDGADEIFCGYPRYLQSKKLSKLLFWMHPQIRSPIASLTKHISRIIYKNERVTPKRLEKFINILGSMDSMDIYHAFISHWNNPEEIVTYKQEMKKDPLQNSYNFKNIIAQINNSGLFDSVTKYAVYDMYAYLVDDILVKVDRASMACSLETRAPFLNHKLAKHAWSMPPEMRVTNGVQKIVLKDLLAKYVPKKYFERPKKGFSIPLEYWLRGDLKQWADGLLNPTLIAEQGIFDANRIDKTWRDFKTGNNRWHNYIWDILMFQSWINK